MVKGFAVSALLVLLLSSVSLGEVVQGQGFTVGNLNGVYSAGPESSSANTNVLTVAQDQMATDGAGHVTAFQGEAGSLVQSAGAMALAGLLGVEQTGLGAGVQGQLLINPLLSLGTQTQDLAANLVQNIVGDGMGTALGLQNFVGFQTQLTFSLWGATANTQAVGVGVFDAFGGGDSGPAAAVISGGTSFGIGQNQMP
jgi:hypothetical protein